MTLEEMQEQVERIYIDIENELLINIANKISRGKPMEIDKFDLATNSTIPNSGEVNEWQLELLKGLDGLNEENAQIIAEYSGVTTDEVNKIFERAGVIGNTVDSKIINTGIKMGVLHEINEGVAKEQTKKIINFAINDVLTTFNKVNNSLLTSAGTEYTQIVNKVSSQILAGTKTVEKAMQEAVSDLANKGLTSFVARNGACWSPEAYTKMVLRANTQNTINAIQENRIKACGGNYVETSQHVGARPLCSKDQGQIFSLDGNTAPIEDLNGRKIEVRAWSSSSYGEPAGILGINCRHSRHIFVPGLDIYRSQPIDKKENDEAYQERQQQRLYERTIRDKKRDIAMLKEINAESTYITGREKQLKDYTKEYLNFLYQTGRTRVRANEMIFTFSGTNKQNQKTLQKYENWLVRQNNKKNSTGLIGLQNNGVKIKDISNHLFERSTFRSIPYNDMVDAFTNPLNSAKIITDEKGRKSIRYVGKKATLNVNPETGNVITVWKTGKATIKKYGSDK